MEKFVDRYMNKLIERQMHSLQKNSPTGVSFQGSELNVRDKARPLYRKILKGIASFNNRDVALPRFLIVGCQKCGTSSLHHYLAQHPSVWSPKKKELHFFDYYYDLGVPTYKKHFKEQPRDIDNLLVGEATPEYIFHPYAAERIKYVLPNNKAIVLLRNPIERAFSAWRMGIQQGWETLSFEDAIAAETGRIVPDLHKMSLDEYYYGYDWNHYSYLLRGHYYDQIDNWLLHFNRENILVISAERFFTNTKSEFRKVCDFLELDEWYPEEFKNMFVGVNDELSTTTRHLLESYYQPSNKKLYELIQDDYEW